MRTTIDLPDDLHGIASAIARDTSRSLSETVADLVRRGLGLNRPLDIRPDPGTGFPVVELGRVVTADDVRALDDDA